MATIGEIYTRKHMQDLIAGFDLINYKTTLENHEVYVGHIHLGKHIFGIFFLLK
jgi:hypothetical protein